MGRTAGCWAIALCACGLMPELAQAQSFGQAPGMNVGPGAGPNVAAAAVGMPGAAMGSSGTALANPYVNPYANPYMNPFLNPYMTQMPGNRNDTLLYFMAAQQARGLGASTNLGASRSGLQGSAPAAAAARPPAGRVAPSRPAPNQRVSGRFDNNPYFNDGRGRLGARYPAFASAPTEAGSGSRLNTPGSPAPNETGMGRYYNRYPSSTRNNGR